MRNFNYQDLSRQMVHKNAKMFFEVYSKWIDGAANQREKDKMRQLVAQHQPGEPGQADQREGT